MPFASRFARRNLTVPLVAFTCMASACVVGAVGWIGPSSVNEESPKPPPLASAMEWVAKITTVSVEMFLPAVGGGYLDRRLGTSYWALVGLVLGVVVGMWHLLQMTRVNSERRTLSGGDDQANRKDNSGGSAGL